jgi:hypothetical protein
VAAEADQSGWRTTLAGAGASWAFRGRNNGWEQAVEGVYSLGSRTSRLGHCRLLGRNATCGLSMGQPGQLQTVQIAQEDDGGPDRLNRHESTVVVVGRMLLAGHTYHGAA